jgi:hypothetical protein
MHREYFQDAQKLKEFVELDRAGTGIGKKIYHEDFHSYVQKFFSNADE